MDRFEKRDVLGDGTFGVVYRGVEKETDRVVALKKIRIQKPKEGISHTALREIKLLKELHHPNIIQLIEVYFHKRNLYLVFEYMDSDLEKVIADTSCNITPACVKAYLQMTLLAIEYCHDQWILHRDLKPNNLLISPTGVLKLADFGLARIYGSPEAKLTAQVFQRWYRAPELLFGCTQYDYGVDMWGVGCIFAELMLKRPYFRGNSDFDQLTQIFAALGTPTEKDWPGMRSLPNYCQHSTVAKPDKRQLFTTATEDALHLLNCLLTFDPNRRISATDGLKHRYFRTSPAPCPTANLPRPAKKQTKNSTSPSTLKQSFAHPEQYRDRDSFPPSAQMDSAPRTEPGHEPVNRTDLPPPPATTGAMLPAGGPGPTSMADETPSSTVHPQALQFQSTGNGVPNSSCDRPGLNSDDRKFFRKRKLQLDQDLDAAFGSQSDSEDEDVRTGHPGGLFHDA